MLTIKKLKELIKDCPDGMPVVIPGSDHSYNFAEANLTTGLFEDGMWSEDFGEEMTPEKDYGKRIKVLLIK